MECASERGKTKLTIHFFSLIPLRLSRFLFSVVYHLSPSLLMLLLLLSSHRNTHKHTLTCTSFWTYQFSIRNVLLLLESCFLNVVCS